MPLVFAALVTTGRLLCADDQPAPSPDGYKTIPIGKDGAVRVKEQPDALAHASFPDELDSHRALSATNPMGTKSFSFPSNTVGQANSDFKNGDQNAFITKPYTFDTSSHSVPNLNTKSEFATTSAYNQGAAGFDKSYSTSPSNMGQSQAALLASTTSEDQNRTAILGGHTTGAYASSLSHKTFTGDEAQAANRRLSPGKNGQMLVQDIPNRDMTIDEVRELINHGFKPNTDAKPEQEPSKPLNDPGYVPQPLRAEPTGPASPATTGTSASDEDKDDAVPPPGTMSATPPPENSQPLPQP